MNHSSVKHERKTHSLTCSISVCKMVAFCYEMEISNAGILYIDQDCVIARVDVDCGVLVFRV